MNERLSQEAEDLHAKLIVRLVFAPTLAAEERIERIVCQSCRRCDRRYAAAYGTSRIADLLARIRLTLTA